MTTKLSKSLADLIDETLAEIEELKKSDRFSAEEIELGEKSAQGGLSKEEAEKAEDEEDEDEEDEDEDEEAKKAEDEEDEDEDDEEDDVKKAESEMAKAEEECKKAEDAYHKALKKREMCKADLKDKKPSWAKKSEGVNLMVKEEKEMKKSLEKSIDARISPLENKLAQVLDVVKQIAESPLPQRGHTYRHVQPLAKSAPEIEPLNKSAVLNKLLDLKKTGTDVDAADVVRIEVGGNGDLQEVANKYGIK